MNGRPFATAAAAAFAALLVAATAGAAAPAGGAYPVLEDGHTVWGPYDGWIDTPSGPRPGNAVAARHHHGRGHAADVHTAHGHGHAHGAMRMHAMGDSLAAHPAPRPGITAEHVITPERLIAHGYEKEAPVYAAVARYPQIVDGLYCYCHCSQRNQHYSLLTCFESGHAANCFTCLGSGELAARLAAEGKTLDEIRAAVDEQFGRRTPLPH